MGERSPRASQKRRSLKDVSPVVHNWLRDSYGEFSIVVEHTGGLSVGCASSIETKREGRLFVKAVDVSPNDPIADLLRHEAYVLSVLPPSDFRPAVVDFFDNGEWVALVTAHVEGYYPDFQMPAEFAVVAEAILNQTEELSPPPEGIQVPSLRDTTSWWVGRWEEIQERPHEFLPDWAEGFAGMGFDAAKRVNESMTDETICHFDVRNDNIFLAPDGENAIVFDWGIAMTGPKWADKVMLALQLNDLYVADAHLRTWLTAEEQNLVDDFLIAFGGSQAWDSKGAVSPRQPNLRSYLRDDAERLLRLAMYRVRPPAPL